MTEELAEHAAGLYTLTYRQTNRVRMRNRQANRSRVATEAETARQQKKTGTEAREKSWRPYVVDESTEELVEHAVGLYALPFRLASLPLLHAAHSTSILSNKNTRGSQ